MSEQKQKLVAVTLLKPHTDAEIQHPAGAVIHVSEPVRDWLANNKIIESPTAKEGGK